MQRNLMSGKPQFVERNDKLKLIGFKLTHRRISRLLIVAVLFALPSVARAQQAGQIFTAPDDIDYRK